MGAQEAEIALLGRLRRLEGRSLALSPEIDEIGKPLPKTSGQYHSANIPVYPVFSLLYAIIMILLERCGGWLTRRSSWTAMVDCLSNHAA